MFLHVHSLVYLHLFHIYNCIVVLSLMLSVFLSTVTPSSSSLSSYLLSPSPCLLPIFLFFPFTISVNLLLFPSLPSPEPVPVPGLHLASLGNFVGYVNQVLQSFPRPSHPAPRRARLPLSASPWLRLSSPAPASGSWVFPWLSLTFCSFLCILFVSIYFSVSVPLIFRSFPF